MYRVCNRESAMLTKIYTQNPSQKELQRTIELLERDGVVIYPTDSVYAFGCSILSAKGAEQLQRLRGKRSSEPAIVFADLAQVAEYCRVDNAAFRILRRNLPGPFTFVLPASSRIPARVIGKRKTIGIRIPDHPVARAIVEALGAPLITASVHDESEEEYTTDPELIHERYGREVAQVIDGGIGDSAPTTVVDLTQGEPTILREGKGELD